MNELDLAFYTVVPLAFLSFIILIYYILRKRKDEEEASNLDVVLAKEQEQESSTDYEPIPEDNQKYWEKEHVKEVGRHNVFEKFKGTPKTNGSQIASIKKEPTQTKKEQVKTLQIEEQKQEKIIAKSDSKKAVPIQNKVEKNDRLAPLRKVSSPKSKNSPNPNSKNKHNSKETLSRLKRLSKRSKPDSMELLKKNFPSADKEESIKKLSRLKDRKTKLFDKLKGLHK